MLHYIMVGASKRRSAGDGRPDEPAESTRSRVIHRPLRLLLAALVPGALAGVVLAGCAAPRRPGPVVVAASPTPEELTAIDEAREQKVAQTAWCGYLQELYQRAAKDGGAWPRYEQCTEITTMAAPRMLKHTADCSREALHTFKGDPFTPEYSSMVSRCGAEALDSIVVTDAELSPFVTTICGRMSTCGQAEYGQCREKLSSGVGPHLQRATGAINAKGRAQLRACLKGVSCDDLTTQISACVEPMMEGLLWLP
jgi:hypothetical protein